MFWNSEFLNTALSQIDIMLELPTLKLSEILFEDDLLQELKTSNVNLINFMNKPDVLTELVDNIVGLTETDCCDKKLYSRIHVAYVSCEILTSLDLHEAFMKQPEFLGKIINCLDTVVPQKAALVSKIISTIHGNAATNLSCHITQDVESYSKMINLLIDNIEISGCFEILSIFLKRTAPPDVRYVFCEILSKLKFVQKLIDLMTLSDNEERQKNACQILCDIIVIGRQEAFEQSNSGPMAQDMLTELLESKQGVQSILNQMFPDDNNNTNNNNTNIDTNTITDTITDTETITDTDTQTGTRTDIVDDQNVRKLTAIVCGIKVLQTLLEQKQEKYAQLVAITVEQTQEEIEKHLIKFHELLLNPPKQEPIKTTFGIIQKPLGFVRLEVVNLIKAFIGTNSAIIIRKLFELKTMDVLIDLFIDYPWNNLLHTQVEQALCLIISNSRGEDGASKALLSQLLNECDLIGRLLIPKSTGKQSNRNNGEHANFGHIIKMITSIYMNRSLDVISNHLNEMRTKTPELYDRWTTFVNVDVASFKERQTPVEPGEVNLIDNLVSSFVESSDSATADSFWPTTDDCYHFYSYLGFTSENVIPIINKDVLPAKKKPNQDC